MLAYTIDGNKNISLVVNGKQFYVSHADSNQSKVMDVIKMSSEDDRESKILDLLDRSKPVKEYLLDSDIEVFGGNVMYQGEVLNNLVCERILQFMKDGLPYQPLVNFLKKLMDNPSKKAADQLYSFLEVTGLVICEDGDFLAYKAVRNDYKDKYTGRIDNSVGSKPKMRRATVCDDSNVYCSDGLHAGSFEYASGYATGDDRLILVKINPADAVSVPLDENRQKLRACQYEVIADCTDRLQYPLADNSGNKYSPEYDDPEYDDDDDDDDDDSFDWN